MKQLQRPSAQSAFSLMELLIVIMIIVVLAALFLTATTASKGKARQIQCVGNLRQLGIALQGFSQETTVYPLENNLEIIKGGRPEHYNNWMEALSYGELGIPRSDVSYFTSGVWRCSAARWTADQAAVNTANVWFSYGYNSIGLNSPGKNDATGLGGRTTTAFGPTAPPVSESDVAIPSEMFAISDNFDGNHRLQRASWSEVHNSGNVSARHNRRANVVFCDGHVESPTLKFLFEDTSDAALVRWNRDHLPHREKLPP
jgi:prepilin-type processing-associated H-X9-DG protein/prepilin-type N-terminal cleavage/methylation domain-containing protein